jgi:hypothetical protein
MTLDLAGFKQPTIGHGVDRKHHRLGAGAPIPEAHKTGGTTGDNVLTEAMAAPRACIRSGAAR